MRSHSRSTCLLLVIVAALLWSAHPIGAGPLESWDNKIPNATLRFKVLPEFNNAAVLDRETQLVWERSPSTDLRDWISARTECPGRSSGERRAWRLPSVHELASLIDASVAQPGPVIPGGHPFSNVQQNFYWTATAFAGVPDFAWEIDFRNGNETQEGTTSVNYVWCARGPMNADAY